VLQTALHPPGFGLHVYVNEAVFIDSLNVIIILSATATPVAPLAGLVEIIDGEILS
jgi:hypothetical protein